MRVPSSFRNSASHAGCAGHVTGYIRGGVTALGMKKDFPVIVDETIELWDSVSVSAGQRGLQIVIAPADYLRATRAEVGEISREK